MFGFNKGNVVVRDMIRYSDGTCSYIKVERSGKEVFHQFDTVLDMVKAMADDLGVGGEIMVIPNSFAESRVEIPVKVLDKNSNSENLKQPD